MDYQETPDLDFSEPIVPESEANDCEETPNLVFTDDVAAALEEDDIDDLDEPDQYVESANDEVDEQNVNENTAGSYHKLFLLGINYFPNSFSNKTINCCRWT